MFVILKDIFRNIYWMLKKKTFWRNYGCSKFWQHKELFVCLFCKKAVLPTLTPYVVRTSFQVNPAKSVLQTRLQKIVASKELFYLNLSLHIVSEIDSIIVYASRKVRQNFYGFVTTYVLTYKKYFFRQNDPELRESQFENIPQILILVCYWKHKRSRIIRFCVDCG